MIWERWMQAYNILDLSRAHPNKYRRQLASQKLRELLQINPKTSPDIATSNDKHDDNPVS